MSDRIHIELDVTEYECNLLRLALLSEAQCIRSALTKLGLDTPVVTLDILLLNELAERVLVARDSALNARAVQGGRPVTCNGE